MATHIVEWTLISGGPDRFFSDAEKAFRERGRTLMRKDKRWQPFGSVSIAACPPEHGPTGDGYSYWVVAQTFVKWSI